MQYLYIGIIGLLFCFMAVKTVSTYFWESKPQSETPSNVITQAGEESPQKANDSDDYKSTATSSKFSKTARPSDKKPKKAVLPSSSASMFTGTELAPEVLALIAKVQSLDSSQIQSEIEKIINGDSVPPALRAQALRAVTKEWAKEDPQAALDFFAANQLDPKTLNYEAEQEVLKELAKTSPAAAEEALVKLVEGADTTRSLFLTDYIASVATGWAQNDPEGAFNWLDQQDFEDGTKAFNKYINELTKIDEDLAFDQINRLAPEKQAEAIKGISSEWGKDAAEGANWETVQNRIDTLPEDIKDEALRNALIPYSKDNPQEAMDIISAIPENNTEKNRVVYQVLDQLGQDNHREKIEWAVQNSTENYTSHVAGTVLMPWIQEDAHGAMQWLSEQPISKSSIQLAKRYLNDESAPINYKEVLREKFNIPE